MVLWAPIPGSRSNKWRNLSLQVKFNCKYPLMQLVSLVHDGDVSRLLFVEFGHEKCVTTACESDELDTPRRCLTAWNVDSSRLMFFGVEKYNVSACEPRVGDGYRSSCRFGRFLHCLSWSLLPHSHTIFWPLGSCVIARQSHVGERPACFSE